MRRHDAELIALEAQRRATALADGVGSDGQERDMVGTAARYGALHALKTAGVIDDD